MEEPVELQVNSGWTLVAHWIGASGKQRILLQSIATGEMKALTVPKFQAVREE